MTRWNLTDVHATREHDIPEISTESNRSEKRLLLSSRRCFNVSLAIQGVHLFHLIGGDEIERKKQVRANVPAKLRGTRVIYLLSSRMQPFFARQRYIASSNVMYAFYFN